MKKHENAFDLFSPIVTILHQVLRLLPSLPVTFYQVVEPLG